MQLKPITAIIVLSLVIASLSIAGCTTEVPIEVQVGSHHEGGYISTAYPTSGRSQLVSALINDEKEWAESRTVKRTVDVVWESNTKATITENIKYKMDNDTSAYTYIHFPTVEAANTYFDSQSSKYEHRSETISSGPVDYEELTGHNQTVYKQRADYDSPGIGRITQYDALIVESYYYSQSPANQA